MQICSMFSKKNSVWQGLMMMCCSGLYALQYLWICDHCTKEMKSLNYFWRCCILKVFHILLFSLHFFSLNLSPVCHILFYFFDLNLSPVCHKVLFLNTQVCFTHFLTACLDFLWWNHWTTFSMLKYCGISVSEYHQRMYTTGCSPMQMGWKGTRYIWILKSHRNLNTFIFWFLGNQNKICFPNIHCLGFIGCIYCLFYLFGHEMQIQW